MVRRPVQLHFIALFILLSVSQLHATVLAVAAPETVIDSAYQRTLKLEAPTEIKAADVPNDGGNTIRVAWTFPDNPYEVPTAFEIFRSGEGGETLAGTASGTSREYLDTAARDGIPFKYRVQAQYKGGVNVSGGGSESATSSTSYFDWSRLQLAIITVILISAILIYVAVAASGKSLFIRKIAGVVAIEEAVGRATEMGKPVLFVPGTQDMDNVQTVAGLTILASVAKMTAKYETKLDVPVSRSITMSTGRETVHEAYLASGRPDLYHDDIVHYITDEQFGFVAAIDGIMVRDQPAACIYMGAFFAESLILAETGNGIGAIQIAGTAMPTQLPFFVAACDYTLIGEELFAASAYLSGDKRAIGSLKGQDVGKAIAMALIGLTSLTGTIAAFGNGWFERSYQFLWHLTSLAR